MTRLLRRALTLTLALSPLSAQAPTSTVAEDTAALAAACNDFAVRLMAQRDPVAGLTCSPGSIAVALHMLLPGASGETAEQLCRVLGLPDDLRGTRLGEALRTLLEQKQVEDGPVLRIANDVWVQEGQPLLDDYLATVRRVFGAAPTRLDFVHDAEAARQRINAHVAKATNDRIPELLQADHVDAETRVVLTNALWFRGAWLTPFAEGATSARPFHLADGSEVDVPTMHVVDTFGIAAAEDHAAIVLPFAKSQLQLEVVLPKGHGTLAGAERALLAGAHLPRLQYRDVRLRMPRFCGAGKFELRPALEQLGMTAAFDPSRADFSRMSGRRDLFVSEVVHEAWIQVDERGAEAAAATAVVMKRTGAAADPAEFAVGRPFAFGLRDRRTGMLWFVGRVLDPRIAR